MASVDAVGSIRVTVAYSPAAGVIDEVALVLPLGSTVATALGLSGLCVRHGKPDAPSCLGIWSKRCTPETVLREHDRLEIYRPLQIDPKDARRLRQQEQRSASRG